MLKKLASNLRKTLAPKTISPIAKPKKTIKTEVARAVMNPKVQKFNNTMNKITSPNTPIGYIPSRSVAIGKSIGDFAVRDPLSKVNVRQKPANYAKQAVSVLAKDKGIQDVVKKSAGIGSYLGTAASLGNSINKGLAKRALTRPTKKVVDKMPVKSVARKIKAPKVKTTEAHLKEMAKRTARKQNLEDKLRLKGYKK